MMRILAKHGDEMDILALPHETVRKGEYLSIEEGSDLRTLLIQAYEETYMDAPGVDEEILRDELFHPEVSKIDDPNELQSVSYMIKDARVLRCKIRASIDGQTLSHDVNWLPSRAQNRIQRFPYDKMIRYVSRPEAHRIDLGNTIGGEGFGIDCEDLDGRLTIITGKKESGKSHLSKLLISGLIAHGAYVVVFDINGEYGGISFNKDGGPSPFIDRVKNFQVGSNLGFTLKYLGKRVFIDILSHALDTPSITVREFMKIWDHLVANGRLNMRGLYDAILNWQSNEMVKNALLSRYYSLMSTRLFIDSEVSAVDFKDTINKFPSGVAMIFSLPTISSLSRRILVQIVLTKLLDLLEGKEIPPIFLFAEEAHLYLRDTYWEDLITRMRHYGIFTTFITNQPDALGPSVYRQADNIFLFNFTNERDLEMIAQAAIVDADTVKGIVRTLPRRHCLALGKVVAELPVTVSVRDAQFVTLGSTRLFFNGPTPIEPPINHSKT
ncbi:MAG: ATP-binding protein [Nitrososphaerota archaeon]|nr:ATP-binding protein [Nitrososphaerota archaeon]